MSGDGGEVGGKKNMPGSGVGGVKARVRVRIRDRDSVRVRVKRLGWRARTTPSLCIRWRSYIQLDSKSCRYGNAHILCFSASIRVISGNIPFLVS